jgi:phosphoserine phosphatase RsbU/P
MTHVVQTGAERMAQVIFKHAARIAREKDISALAQLNADLARDLLGAERCSLWLLDNEHRQLWTRVAHGVSELRIPDTLGIVGVCVAENRPIIINNAQADPRFFFGVDDQSGYRTHSMICVPLRSDDQVIGAIQVLNKREGFSREDAELLSFIAFYSASAIQAERLRRDAEAAMLMRHEMGLASEVQRRLLPEHSLSVEGLQLAAVCRPAACVSGDFYDVLPLPDGAIGITLGDVSGKGLPAAVMMASIHPLLRNLLLRNSDPLARVVRDLSDSILQSSSPERYSTLFCGVLNHQRTRLAYVNAGHVPPFIIRHATGRIEHPTGGDVPVGLMPFWDFTEQSAVLSAGDVFVCISDGILEAQDAKGHLWDSSCVAQILSETRHLSVNEIVERLVQAVDAYAGGSEQRDDITAIVLKVNELPNGGKDS